MNFLRRRKNDSEDDDLSEHDGGTASQVQKSRKPPNTAFRQQRLKSWQPILTPKTVIPFLFLLSCVFAPLGIAILYTTYNVENMLIDYTHCTSAKDSYSSIPKKYTNWHFQGKSTDPELKWKLSNSTDSDGDLQQTCTIQFNLPKDLKPPVYVYYKLTNFYQNHRKYVESYDVMQLQGSALTPSELTDKCNPLRLEKDDDGNEKAIFPCGLIANSLFNDTYSNPVLLNSKSGSDNETYYLSSTDISWRSDRKHKFKKTKYTADQIVPPPNWRKQYPQGYNDLNIPDLSHFELLHNWMRTAGLPTFYKLYAKNSTTDLSLGTYEMDIALNYPVSVFGGSKSLVITTNNVLGGRNLSLGIIYIIVAVVSMLCAIVFFFHHLINPRKIGDHNFLQDTSTGFRDSIQPPLREQL